MKLRVLPRRIQILLAGAAVCPVPRRPEEPLAGEATRAVRPYVVAAEQAARRREAELAALGPVGHGLYVMCGVEVA